MPQERQSRSATMAENQDKTPQSLPSPKRWIREATVWDFYYYWSCCCSHTITAAANSTFPGSPMENWNCNPAYFSFAFFECLCFSCLTKLAYALERMHAILKGKAQQKYFEEIHRQHYLQYEGMPSRTWEISRIFTEKSTAPTPDAARHPKPQIVWIIKQHK